MFKQITRSPHYIVAAALLLITLSVNISMPLFRVYAAAAHLNNGQTALVFASYVLGMLPCYILLGGLSDRVGRKPVLTVSVLCAFCATAIITMWPTALALVFARFFQGVALGLGMGTGAAYLSELLQPHPQAATKAAGMASLFTAFGFGGGALATSLVLLVSFTMVPVTYFFLLSITLIGIALVFTLPNLKPIGGKLLRLPYFPTGSLPVNSAIAICWAATGVVIAIIPTQLAKFGLTPYAGICLVLVNWTGAFIQPLIRNIDPVKSVKIGLLLIPIGFALVITGCSTGLLLIVFAGTSIIGMAAYGFSYLGGLALIANLGGHQKARAVSGYMFFGYIGFGIPAICLGYFADHFGIINSLLLFECCIILVSCWLALVLHRKTYTVSRPVIKL
jgi:predicted MFS family arabinose efflux permease